MNSPSSACPIVTIALFHRMRPTRGDLADLESGRVLDGPEPPGKFSLGLRVERRRRFSWYYTDSKGEVNLRPRRLVSNGALETMSAVVAATCAALGCGKDDCASGPCPTPAVVSARDDYRVE